MRSCFIFILSFFLFTSLVYTILINKNEVCPMMKRLYYSLIITIGYLIVSNLGNMVFGISKEFSWTTTLWESLFFFIFVFLLQMDLSQYLGHILVETVKPFFLLLILQIPVGLDSESSYGFDFGYKILQCS